MIPIERRAKISFGAVVFSLLISNATIWSSEVKATVGVSSSFEFAKPFLTEKGSYISLVNTSSNNGNSSIKPLITSGEQLPNNYTFANIPDGLGAVQIKSGTVDVFVNHELENKTDHGGFAKVSRLRLNQTDGSIMGAELIINGSEGYKRFCSASLVEGYGFEHPVFFTNEEVGDGIVLAIDAANGTVTEMPWLGKFSHENTIHVPYFSNSINKTVLLGFEDGEPTESEVYMYVADTPKDLVTGRGQLYVFGSISNVTNAATENQSSTSGSWNEIYFSNGTINGKFIPLKWNYKNQNETDLDNEAIVAGGFEFIRPEDGALDKRENMRNILYMADTGSETDENDKIIPAGINGQDWTKGRIYKFTFTDIKDPTKALFEVIMDGNDPLALGYNVLKNPDNVDTGINNLMINEDFIDASRLNATAPYDITNNAKILRVDIGSQKTTNAANNNTETIAYVNQSEDLAARYGDWESSGILDVSKYFGKGSWLTSVQAHTIKEGGQLSLLHISGS
jgi:hypothetical protein